MCAALCALVAADPAGAAGGTGGASGTTAGHHATSLSQIVLPQLGFGYLVTSQGPLGAESFGPNSPDPTIASGAGALSSLGKDVSTYQRSWDDPNGTNQVQDLLVKFSSLSAAQAFLKATRTSIDSGEIVSSGTLPSVPDARRTTYFASTDRAGVGQAITMQSGLYVDVLSLFSSAAGNPAPITPASADRVAKAQYAAMAAAPGGGEPIPAPKPGTSWSGATWAVVAVVVLAGAAATPLFLRRRSTHGTPRRVHESE